MGTYCELYVADYPALPEKSQASAIAMTMFRETDKIVAIRPVTERNAIQWDHVDWDPDEKETAVEYRASVAAVKDRLRVMGFTLSRVEREFSSTKEARVTDLRRMAEGCPELYQEEIALLSSATFSDFLAAFHEILTSKVHPVWIVERVPDASALVRYILKDNEDFYWGFPCRDLRCFFRALLEVVPDSESVTQELTDLVHGGYYGVDTRVAEFALQELKGDYSVNSPVIVLTEGPTDNESIQAALELLYPHLEGYFSFMDLAVRSPGGAGSLVHVVKSFVGAGVENRVVALFDNDTAGHSAASLLKNVRLPSRIRVLQYPDIDLAKSYPTDGPTGPSNQDINGSACSIELYFGRDVLTASGRLVPVQWRGYDARMRRYQGEIQSKDALKTAFLTKVAAACENPARLITQDWTDMRRLLKTLVDAFNVQ